MSDAIPTELLDHRYRLETLLGRGGMGAVYRALDTRLDRPVAIKMLRDVDGADKARFDGEVRLLARFTHPNLVRVLDAGEFDGRPYLVMELIEGVTLARRLADGRLPAGDVANIGAGIAAALAYAHNAGIVHRDVKPANILLDQSGRAHLADFGIARLVDTTGMTATGLTLGTPAYLAPEQIQGSPVGPPADVYALGLVLFECLTGRRAFEGTASEITAARLGRDPEIPRDLDPAWQVLLRSMTIRNPDDRPVAAVVAETLAERIRTTDPLATIPLDTFSDKTVAFAAGAGAGSDTAVLPDPTATAVDRSQVARRARPTASPRAKQALANKTIPLAVGIAVIVLLLGLTFGGVFSSSPSSQPPSTTAPTTSTTAPSTTTTSTTSTTVPTATVASTTNGLISALEAGVANGSVASPAAQQLDNQLQALLFPPAGAQPAQQIQQFDALAHNFDQDVANGMITGSSTISALTASIGGLATALGTTIPATTIAPSPPGPGGNGPGHGHGHGKEKG